VIIVKALEGRALIKHPAGVFSEEPDSRGGIDGMEHGAWGMELKVINHRLRRFDRVTLHFGSLLSA